MREQARWRFAGGYVDTDTPVLKRCRSPDEDYTV